MMRAPSSEWACMTRRSSGVSLPGLSRIASGMASLPMSWNRAACPSTSSSSCDMFSSRPIAKDSSRTRREWPAVYVSRASTVAERLSIASVECSLSSTLASSSETFWRWIVTAASRSFSTLRRVYEMYASCVLRMSSSGTANTTSA